MRLANPKAIWKKAFAFVADKRLELGLAITGVIILFRLFGLLQVSELLTLDRLQHISPAEARDSKVVLVGIDEDYIEKKAALEYGGLATLLEKVLAAQPTVVGIDIVENDLSGVGRNKLISLIEENKKLVAVDKVVSPEILPFKGLSETVLNNRVGFNDFSSDDDFQVRRMFLGWSPNQPEDDSFRESLALILAKQYLFSTKGAELTNGKRDRDTMRFEDIEIPRLKKNSGGYHQEDLIYGIQTLINFRSGRISLLKSPKPFEIIKASEIDSGRIDPERFKGKIAIFGIVAPSLAVEFDSVLPQDLNYDQSRRMTGLELQAHATSQIVSAVVDGRPLIHTLSTPLEYLFIAAFGMLGVGVKALSKSTARGLVALGTISLALCFLSYLGLVETGLWLPLAPAMLALAINGVAYIAVSQSERRWQALVLERDRALAALKLERQKTIEHAFDTIHNGPLQTLANLLRLVRDRQISLLEVSHEIEKLNQEIREVGDALKQDSISDESVCIKVGKSRLDLSMPLHELFYEIYRETLERPFPGFKTLKIQARSLEPVEPENITIECKRKLCRFFEETLCNVGKHAIGATRLTVTGKTINNCYVLKIVDNGVGFEPHKVRKKGRGTKISHDLESALKGTFLRRSNHPKGILCEFRWTLI